MEALAGRLQLRPGQARPLSGSRPVLGAAVLPRLVQGLAPAALPARLAAVFSLCGAAHRLTAARAVRAALGEAEPADGAARALWATENLLLHLWTAREHLQRLALDLPSRLPVAGVPADGAWLRGHPLARLPADAAGASAAELHALAGCLLPWLEDTVFGGKATDWQRAWEEEQSGPAAPASPLFEWCHQRSQPVMRWLHGAAGAGRALALPCRPVPAEATSPGGLRWLGERLGQEPGFAAQPHWQGAPAETGCWTRLALADAGPPAQNAWMRWQYRMAELLALAQPGSRPVLHAGAITLAEGRGLAWSEMSRGLLVHRVDLRHQNGGWVVEECRVLAPTEWNFHPAGGLARALACRGLALPVVQAAVAALDPCVALDVLPEAEAADA